MTNRRLFPFHPFSSPVHRSVRQFEDAAFKTIGKLENVSGHLRLI
jgi:hypothetical protein